MHSPESFDNTGHEPIPQGEVFELNPEGDVAALETGLALLARLQEAQTRLDELTTSFNALSVDEQADVAVISTLADAQMDVKNLQDQLSVLGTSAEELTALYGENPSPDVPSLENLGDAYKI